MLNLKFKIGVPTETRTRPKPDLGGLCSIHLSYGDKYFPIKGKLYLLIVKILYINIKAVLNFNANL